MVEKLSSASATRFKDFQNRKIDFQTFAHSFNKAIENIPGCFQLKIMQLQVCVNF